MIGLDNSRLIVSGSVLVAVLTVIGMSAALAQQTHPIAWKGNPKNTSYPQQFAIDVGDVPGHQIRIFEIHRTYPQDPPKYDGVAVVESWSRGYSDYVNQNGPHWGYAVDMMENGDKILSRYDGTSQTAVQPDGSKRSTFVGVTHLTGGTGKFRTIRGTIRYNGVFDPKAGLNEIQNEGEYWMEK